MNRRQRLTRERRAKSTAQARSFQPLENRFLFDGAAAWGALPLGDGPLLARDDAYQTPAGHDLIVDAAVGGEVLGLESAGTVSVSVEGRELAFSPQFGLLAVRESTRVVLIDAASGAMVNEHAAVAEFTDLDLTPDGRYLFVADYSAPDGWNPDVPADWVHRFDLKERVWEVAQAPKSGREIEALSAQVVALWSSRWTINSFGPGPEMVELNSGFYASLVGYDSARELLVQANFAPDSFTVTLSRDAAPAFNTIGQYGFTGVPFSWDDPLSLVIDEQSYFLGPAQVEALDPNNVLHVYPSNVVAAGGGLAFTDDAYFASASGERLGALPFAAVDVTVSSDGREVWALDSAGHAEHFLIQRRGRGLLANDQGDAVEAVIATNPSHGEVEISADGTFVYRADPGFLGQDSFGYRAVGADRSSSLAAVTISVQGPPVNRAPVIDNLSLAVEAGNSVELSLEQGRSGPGLAAFGQFSARGNVEQMLHSAQHDQLFTRSARAIRVWDATTGALLATREARGQFSDMDLSPDGNYLFVSDYGGQAYFGGPAEPSLLLRLDLRLGNWDVKVALNALWRIESLGADRIVGAPPSRGFAALYGWSGFNSQLVAINSLEGLYPGDMHYDANLRRLIFTQESSYLYEYLVTGDEFTPLQSNYRVGSDELVASPDGTRLYTGDVQREMGTLWRKPQAFPEPIRAATNSLAFGDSSVYSAVSGLQVGELAFESAVQVAAADGQRWWSFDAASDTIHVYRIGQPTAGLLSRASDADGDPLTLHIVDMPTHGTLDWNADGKATYRPEPGFVGQDTFTYRAFDGQAASSSATVTVRVASIAPDHPANDSVPDQFWMRTGSTLAVESMAGAALTLLGVLDQWWDTEAIDYSPAYDLVALRTGRGVVTVVRGATGETVLGPTDEGYKADFSPDGRYLFLISSGANDGRYDWTPYRFPFIHRYDLALEQWETRRSEQVITEFAALNGEQLVFLGSPEQARVFWAEFGPSSRATITSIADLETEATGSIEVDPRRNQVFFASDYGRHLLRRWQLETPWPTLMHQYLTPNKPPDGYGSWTLATDAGALFLGKVQLDPNDLERQLRTYPEIIRAANARWAFGADNYYDLQTGQVAGTWQYPGSPLSISDDGRHLWVNQGGRWLHYFVSAAGKGVLANDRYADGANVRAELVSGPQHGRLELAADGTFRYTPNAGFVGEDRFEYRFQADQGWSAATPVMITVRPTNAAPMLAEIPAQPLVEGQVLPPLPLTISDPTSAGDEITATASVDNADLVTGLFLEGEGFARRLRIETAAGKVGTARITVQVSDGEFSIERAFDLVVRSVNDVPLARPDLYSLSQNLPLEISARQGVLANDADGDGDALQASLLRSPLHGSLMLAVDGGFRYVPHQGYVGDDSFSYRAADGTAIAEAEVALYVIDNSAPRIVSTNVSRGTQLPGPLQLRVLFNEALQASLLDPSDLVLTGSLGRAPARAVSFDAASFTVLAEFGEWAIGEYTLQILSNATSFVDLAGLRLDGEPSRNAGGLSGNGVAGGDFTVTFVVAAATFDIDGDGAALPATDGELVRRYLAGRRGAELVDSAVAPTATRSTAEQIEAYFARTSGMLDIDGNSQLELGFDDVLLRRFLTGIEGDELIVGALAGNATRVSAAAIEDWLDEHMPALAGDANRDGVVDLNDFAALKAGFGRVNAGRRGGDLDRSGTVNLADFGLLKANFGRKTDG